MGAKSPKVMPKL